ncbi:hypothetical protein GKZ28_20375 [Clostridium chromiireducens]|uniref:Uncharacterized protein n=1 Tax=Clostridium chromiireducens TaxID=225345 RepID=A0A964W4B4_9CLOT|nr:hypothetical protein [Clostridium chromiireducens]MVX66038.1 hypothetical protein [Clostridium chromiireducens]
MNKIKDSFSKIKASDEFKDKLEKELLNTQSTLKTIPSKRIYYKPSIVAASILFILLGVVSLKLIMNTFGRDDTNLDGIAYNPIEKSNKEDNNSNSFLVDNSTSEKEETNNSDNNNNNNDGNDILVYADISEANSPEKSSSTKNDISSVNNTPYEEDKKAPSEDSKDIISSHTEKVPFRSIASNEPINAITNTLSDNEVYIPRFELPTEDTRVAAKMIPLIVYNEKIYTRSPIKINSKNAKNLLGKKLGTTNSNINELSSNSEYSTEFASNIGVTDVYSVNGYDEGFRIMTNITLPDGTSYPEFYDSLNGISIKTGADFFGKLKLQNNILSAKFQTFDDWNNGNGISYSINDFNLLNSFVDSLDKSIPYLPENIEPLLGDYGNNENCKKITLNLKDGCENLTFTVLKSGYVYYNSPNVYFKIDGKIIEEIWDKLSIMSIN